MGSCAAYCICIWSWRCCHVVSGRCIWRGTHCTLFHIGKAAAWHISQCCALLLLSLFAIINIKIINTTNWPSLLAHNFLIYSRNERRKKVSRTRRVISFLCANFGNYAELSISMRATFFSFFRSFLAWAARSVASYLAAVEKYLVGKYLVTQLSHTHALALLGQHKHTHTHTHFQLLLSLALRFFS